MTANRPPARTALFLFADHDFQACACGRLLGGSYVELPDEPRGAGRQRMLALRGARWSHEVNGDLIFSLIGLRENEQQVRDTHQLLPANAPDAKECFCGGLGQPYSHAQARGAR